MGPRSPENSSARSLGSNPFTAKSRCRGLQVPLGRVSHVDRRMETRCKDCAKGIVDE